MTSWIIPSSILSNYLKTRRGGKLTLPFARLGLRWDRRNPERALPRGSWLCFGGGKQSIEQELRCLVWFLLLGASPSSRVFYLKTKGETERDITTIGFASLTIARPSMLTSDPRSSCRPLEAFGLFLGKHLSSLLPQHYRAVSTHQVAEALLKAGLDASSGLNIIESEQLPA